MPHPSDIESKLGFDQIRQRLSSYCISTLGKKLVEEVHFNTSPRAVRTGLNQNHEFVQIIQRGDSFPTSQYFDPAEVFAKASIEGTYLDGTEFLKIAASIQTIIGCRDYLVKNKELCPTLFQLTNTVHISSKLASQIFTVIDENGSMKDSASSELSRIRKKIRDEQGRLRKLIEQVYRHAVDQRWVPDGALPTIRGGRLVIPVLAEYKRKVKGFILNESATGQTVFMEPAEVLDANNEIRDLEHAEKREVIKILKQLTDQLRIELHELYPAFTFLSRIDFTQAKAKLSIEIEADMPKVVDHPALNWMRARHPLLYLSLKGKRELVPLTVNMNDQDSMLLVSGPNAGGKSVCLKTIGLLQYMLQCGLLIPASPDSTAGIFEDLFIDIGDQQSIENDLSTYSSHLKNLSHFIQYGNKNTLMLLDELGSGTDPNFGGAIAQAVLKSLVSKKIWGLATTHYYNLKLFAEQQDGIRNAAMRFDEENMVPLYVLDIGKPGSSFALEIAQKTGIPTETLKEAKLIAGKELVGLETLVRNLEKERVELSDKVRKLNSEDVRLKAILQKYESLTAELESRKKQIINAAKEEARQLLDKTNREIEKTIRHIRENQAQKTETHKVRKNLKEIATKLERGNLDRIIRDTPIQAGDRVRIIGQEGSGIVISLSGKTAMVQLGELKSKIDTSKLEKATGQATSENAPAYYSSGLSLHEKRTTYSTVLDVRGKRADEVVSILDQFLDTSVLLGQGEIKILHGKGEGVLRKLIREQLKQYKSVASFSDEHVERGGDGITLVVLK